MSVPSPRANRRPFVCLALTAICGLAGLSGCHSENGGYYSDDRYVYVSRPWEPKTITLMDTRTGEPLWSVDVPVGKQIVVGFSKGTGPNEYKPDEIVWEMMEKGRRVGTRDNRMPCPGRDCRRLDMTLRPTPEMPGTPVPGSPFKKKNDGMTTRPAGYTSPTTGPYIESNKSHQPPPAIEPVAPSEPLPPPPPPPAPEPVNEVPDGMLPPRN